LLAAPVLAFLVLRGHRDLFTPLFLVSLVSDILDGLIARLFRLQTPFGARLDSWADTVTYWVGIAGVLRFAWPAIVDHLPWLLSFVVLAQLLNLAMLVKFHRIVGLHSYSFKLTAYLQGAAALQLLWSGHWSWLCTVAIATGLAACLEELVIVGLMDEPLTDVKGLWWLLGQRRTGTLPP
jgi:CDP-diacylglycerol--glycerol-3-phosphate 3-phosphatidyltransferase